MSEDTRREDEPEIEAMVVDVEEATVGPVAGEALSAGDVVLPVVGGRVVRRKPAAPPQEG